MSDYGIEEEFMARCDHELIMHICVYCSAVLDYTGIDAPFKTSTITGSLSKTRYIEVGAKRG